MSDVTAVWRRRMTRLTNICGAAKVSGPGTRSAAPLIAVTSSRLGRDANLHRAVCQFLCRSLLDCKQRGGELLIASGSAIEPWAERGAELFGIPCRKLVVSSRSTPAHLIVSCPGTLSISVDAAAIAIADRVDAAYVRRGGRIAASLRERLNTNFDACIRVAVTREGRCAAHELICEGAIGWLNLRNAGLELESGSALQPGDRVTLDDQPKDHWGRSEGQWLIHCTRASAGRWPDETEHQYRDAMLLGNVSSAQRGPLDVLLRILRNGRILASAKASSHAFPVVCLSAVSLERLLAHRCFRPHLGRWDYEPFGVAIRTSVAQKQGVQPVIYGNHFDRDGLPEEQRFRFHPVGKKHDWSWEREWRSRGNIDLAAFDPRDVRVFALDSVAARSALRNCLWEVSFLSPLNQTVRSV